MGYQGTTVIYQSTSSPVTCVRIKHAQPTPSTAPPLLCDTHPTQRPPVGHPTARDPTHYTSGRLIGGFLPARAWIGYCRILCFLGNLGLFGITSSLRRRSELPVERKVTLWGKRTRQPVDQESTVEHYCRRHHRPRALRIAPTCKEPPAAQARRVRDQSKSRKRG